MRPSPYHPAGLRPASAEPPTRTGHRHSGSSRTGTLRWGTTRQTAPSAPCWRRLSAVARCRRRRRRGSAHRTAGEPPVGRVVQRERQCSWAGGPEAPRRGSSAPWPDFFAPLNQRPACRPQQGEERLTVRQDHPHRVFHVFHSASRPPWPKVEFKWTARRADRSGRSGKRGACRGGDCPAASTSQATRTHQKHGPLPFLLQRPDNGLQKPAESRSATISLSASHFREVLVPNACMKASETTSRST